MSVVRTVCTRFLPIAVLAGVMSTTPRIAWCADPVDHFIQTSDSLRRSAPSELSTFVSDHAVIVGAAVGVLLHRSFGAKPDGDADGMTLAEQLASILLDTGGSGAPMELVRVHKAWTSGERDIRDHALELEKQAVFARDLRSLDKAVELFEEARALYEQIGDSRSIAVNYGSLGVVHWYRADFEAVMANYELALEARRGIDDRILEGKTLNGLGSANLRTGNYDTSIEFYTQAIDLRRRTGDVAGLGTSLTYLGNCYFQMNRLIDARDYFEEALPLLERVGEPIQMIDILNSVASLYSDMGRFRAANDAYRRGIDIAVRSDIAAHEAACRINLADNLQRVGDYAGALEELDVADDCLVRQPDPYRQADLHRIRAVVFMYTGELDRARTSLIELRRHAEGLGEPLYWIDAQLMTARLYMALGALEKARAAAEEAIITARKHNVVRMERDGEVAAATVEVQLGNYDDAIAHWRTVLKIDESTGSENSRIEAHLGIAVALALKGEYEEARALYREHIKVATENGLLAQLSVVHQGLAHSYEEENPDSAATHYAKALSLFERSHRDVGGAESGSGFLSGERRHVYEEVARYYARLHKRGHGQEWSDRAFATVEAAKARGLLDMLRSAAAYETTAREEALLDSLYTLTKHDPQKASELEKKYLAIRNARINQSVSTLKSSDAMADMDAVTRVLDKGTVMLSYALGDTASLLWVIDKDGSVLHTLPARSQLRAEVQRFRDAIGRPGAGDNALRASARSLYVALIEPAATRVKKADHLVIAPDGILFELPFEALLTRDADDGKGWQDLKFFGKERPIVYVPSASVYVTLTQQDQSGSFDLELLAVGDPEYSAASKLERLPHTREEVLAIGEIVDEKKRRVLLGAQASESAFKSMLKAHRPRIVHLATHGLVDPHQPSASGIALCEPEGGKEDGMLHTLEIASLTLDGGLVVMSACESARGRLSRSEGVVGLSRAFLASGVDGVVASLWAVSDKSTAALMKEMYRHMIGEKRPAAHALWEARCELLKIPEYAHPFHWSPFIAIGTQTSPWS